MNIEGAKENIQPLAAGRNIDVLQVALNAESDPESQQELLLQRRQFEQGIFDYVGEDPLDLWFEYVLWVEQSHPKSGKESALDDLLKRCLSKFEKDDRYKQDQRFIRLFIKYIDTKKNPHQFYMNLYNKGVGTMVSDLYIAWAHYYDIVDNFEQAEQVYQKGLDARAAPIDQLERAHQKFQFSISQRILRKDAYREEFLSSMEERRNAFTSLRSLKSSKVGSIRTGSAIRSNIPGQVKQNQSASSSSSNRPLHVYEGYSENNFKAEPHLSTSVVQDIQNSMMENNVEPGPWSKASSKKGVFHNVPDRKSILKFAILEDADTYQPKIKFGPLPPDDGDNAIKLFPEFPRKNQSQKPFDVPSYVEDSIPPNRISCYDSFFLNPNKDASFSPDELRAYKLFKSKNISNNLTKAQDKIWLTSPSVPMRLPPTFARKNLPYAEFSTEWPDISSIPSEVQYSCKLNELYPEDLKEEFSFEELLREKWTAEVKKNEVMDETICVKGRQSFGVKHTRKSIVTGGRKSIMPIINDRGSIYVPRPNLTVQSSNIDEVSDVDMDLDDDENTTQNGLQFLGKPNHITTGVKSVQQNKHQEHTASTAHSEPKKSQLSSSKVQFSIFNDEEEEPKHTPPLIKTQNVVADVKESLPSVGGWSIFTDDEPKATSPTIFNSKNNSPANDVYKTKEVFAVPQHKPLVESTTSAEKRTLSPAMTGIDIQCEASESKRMLVDISPYPIMAHTGAIKKSIRKSSITENAIQLNQNAGNVRALTPSTNDEFKFPEPVFDQAKTIRTENIDADFTLCTQNFNFNLRDQMVSTPVANRRPEPILAEQQVVTQPLKLSTIMETTEGSAHTASSTKSSTQFSSPEDDDQSKRSQEMNRTKFVGAIVSPAGCDSSVTYKDDCPVQQNFVNCTNYTLPAIQMSLLPKNVSSCTNSIEATLPAKQPPSKYPFPIFEDSQATTTNTATLHAKSPPSAAEHQKPIPSESSLPPPHSSDVRFNLSSICIKDELQTFLSDSATITESFAIPNIPQIESPQPNQTNNIEPEKQYQNSILQPYETTIQDETVTRESTITEDEVADKSRSKLDLINLSMASETDNMSKTNFGLNDSRSSEEEIIEVPDETVVIDGNENAEAHSFSLGDVASGESFVIPSIVNIQSLAQAKTRTNKKDIVAPEDKDQNITVPQLKGRSTFAIDPRISISMVEHEREAYNRYRQNIPTTSENITTTMGVENNDNSDDEIIVVDDDSLVDAGLDDQSIYYKHNSILVEPSWSEDIAEKVIPETDNLYEHDKVNLEESRIVIQSKLAEPNLNPFNEALKTALLQELSFVELLDTNQSSELVKKVPNVSTRSPIIMKHTSFDVIGCIGNGAYGRVYNVRSMKNGLIYAVKKEKPANLWEFYILTEVQKRVSAHLLPGFMKIDYAIIGNDGTLLFSQYSSYGSLLDVCNRVFTSLQQNVSETITFILAIQMLDLVDHLHKNGILHLDLKPDNFLVMQKMSSQYNKLAIQLIDFGNAVDLRQFPPGQKFLAALETKHFVCIEMIQNRPWVYQPDLYCLAGTIHSVLFGKYMEVRKKDLRYEITSKVPRYYNSTVWNAFFDKMINVDENSLPNLQEIRKSFCDAVEETKPDKLEERIKIFNNFIIGK